MTSAERALQREARQLLKEAVSAVEFSEKVFGPQGLLRGLSRTAEERRTMVESELYRWLQGQLAGLRRREVQEFEQETEALSGRVTISIPRSLHAALKREARLEGVSLSELMRLKLAVKLNRSLLSLTEPSAARKRSQSKA